MYGIYANIWGILMVNVTIYGIHGSYGCCYLTSRDINCMSCQQAFCLRWLLNGAVSKLRNATQATSHGQTKWPDTLRLRLVSRSVARPSWPSRYQHGLNVANFKRNWRSSSRRPLRDPRDLPDPRGSGSLPSCVFEAIWRSKRVL